MMPEGAVGADDRMAARGQVLENCALCLPETMRKRALRACGAVLYPFERVSRCARLSAGRP